MLSSTFAALSDPTRRKMLSCLIRGPATVNELARPFAISQQAISKHLAYLESARLIAKRRWGREHFCTLKPEAIKKVAKWADGYCQFWEESQERLDALLKEIKTAAERRPQMRTKRRRNNESRGKKRDHGKK